MRSDAKGHFTTEALIEIAQRLVAALQDAGVTHIRDLSMVYHPTDAKGLDIAVGTLAGPVDTLPLRCENLVQEMPVQKITVLRAPVGRKPSRRQYPRATRSRD
jgi:hypothetical protein